MQKLSRSGLQAILELATNDLDRSQQLPSPDVRDRLVKTISDFLQQKLSFAESFQVFTNACSSTTIINRMRDIVEVGDNPLPSSDNEEDHKKSRSWSSVEDNRLLAGILRNGLENWSTIASFVGNNRTRAQCTQRWARGLNPRISKETWSAEEETRLLSYVRQFGDKSWTKISKLLGTRSDAQCRYHYNQMTKSMPPMTMIALRPRLSMPTIPSNPMMMMAPVPVQIPFQMEARRSSMVQFASRQNIHIQPPTGVVRQQSNPAIQNVPLQVMPPLDAQMNAQSQQQQQPNNNNTNQVQIMHSLPVSLQQGHPHLPEVDQSTDTALKEQNHSTTPNNTVPIDGFLQRFK